MNIGSTNVKAPRVSYEKICQATGGNNIALIDIVRTYESYINKLATVYYFDQNGNLCFSVDSEAAGRMKEKLLMCTLSFSPFPKPTKECLL